MPDDFGPPGTFQVSSGAVPDKVVTLLSCWDAGMGTRSHLYLSLWQDAV